VAESLTWMLNRSISLPAGCCATTEAFWQPMGICIHLRYVL